MPTTHQDHDDAVDGSGAATGATEHRTVRIPGSTDHGGHHRVTVTLPWVCPRCGGPRGPVRPVISHDGSRRLGCDGWTNPCGHIDHYTDVRAQARHLGETP